MLKDIKSLLMISNFHSLCKSIPLLQILLHILLHILFHILLLLYCIKYGRAAIIQNTVNALCSNFNNQISAVWVVLMLEWTGQLFSLKEIFTGQSSCHYAQIYNSSSLIHSLRSLINFFLCTILHNLFLR